MRAAPEYPTQFAAFVLSEISDCQYVIDCGCGSGRDTFFFAEQGRSVLGLDGSIEAVQLCRSKATQRGMKNVWFNPTLIGDPHSTSEVIRFVEKEARGVPVLVYARFLLHALSESEESAFFAFAKMLCGGSGALAVEFRTHRDRFQEKVTRSHFRRYIDPLHLGAEARKADFNCVYHVEGFGFAKYKEDDAHTCRCIFRPVRN